MIQEIYNTLVKKYSIVEQHKGPILPTGSLILNRMLVIGGYPTGRIIEIYGPEGVGKTTMGLHAMVEAQKLKMPLALLDMECCFDERYAKTIGIRGKKNVDYLHLMPTYGEEAIDMLADVLDKGMKLVVVDSVASMVPKAEYEGETGEAFMGLQARMMGQGLRKLTGRISRAGAVVIFINQVRTKIGVFFGSPEVTTGGRALGFYASIRLQLRSGEAMPDKVNPIGRYVRIKVVKNKVGPPLKECQVPLIFGRGIDRAGEIFSELWAVGKITRRSSFYYGPDGEKIGAGVVNSMTTMRESIKVWERIYHEHAKDTSTAVDSKV